MEPLQITATRALRNLLAAQPTNQAKVTFAWKIAAGAALGRAGAPTWSEDGVLRVQAESAAWGREIRRARPLIAVRLKELLGPGVVRAIVVNAPRERRDH